MSAQLLAFSKADPRRALKIALSALTLIFALAAWQFGAQITEMQLNVTSVRFRSAYWVLVAAAGLLALLSIYSWAGGAQRIQAGLRRVFLRLQVLRPVAPFGLALLLVGYPLLLFGFYGNFLLLPFPRLLAFSLAALAGAGLWSIWRGASWAHSLGASILLFASVYCAATFFNLVNNFPFSLEWSEVSRFYQASFYFSEQVYGVRLPLPVTHPSRYLLQSVPFLINAAPLWLHRLWQALLWVGLPLVTAALLARRLQLGAWRAAFIAWSFLFLMQGAVFYHLVPCVFIVLFGFDKDKTWRTVFFIALASVWAGISRINWLPLPGALAALLYLLEVRPARLNQISLRYLWPALLYGAGGVLVAAAAYALYIANSGVSDPGQFGSAFTSDLLWQRLWPSDQFLPGVLPGILLVSLPLALVILLRIRSGAAGLGRWRWLGILALLAVFFFGGLVVSVKIGGGTNLHNMDAYMVLLWVLTGYLAFGPYASKGKLSVLKLPAWLTLFLISVPVLFAVFSGGPLNLPPRQTADKALAEMRQIVTQRTANGEQALLISQRHLLTFHMLGEVPLVHEYEKLFLMEMAISGNEAYLFHFIDSMEDHRFAVIISDPLHTNIYDEAQDALAAENNAWNNNVSRHILCSYQRLKVYPELGIELLVPRRHNCNS